MGLLNVTGLDLDGGMYKNTLHHFTRYCSVTERVLSGHMDGNYVRENSAELNKWIQIYADAGREPDSIGVRMPLVFWLVMCGWTPPQKVFVAMTNESDGPVEEETLIRLFGDRWILESLIEHWAIIKEGDCLAVGKELIVAYSGQNEFVLTPARYGPPESKQRQVIFNNGSMVQAIGNDGRRRAFTFDAFTTAATSWTQRNGHIAEEQIQQLMNEPALPALLSRPQIFKSQVMQDFGSADVLSMRWRTLVKFSLKVLVINNAGPVTARAVFEGISKGLDYFRQEAQR